jgi:hypothetical protein
MLAECLTTAPVLLTFDSRRHSVFTTDASKVKTSAVLTQPDDDDVHHPVANESRKITLPPEQAYPVNVLELLAVMDALRVFRHIDLLAPGRTSRCAPTSRRRRVFLRIARLIVSWPAGWMRSGILF